MEPLVIQNRYALIRRLASGGMGDIFLAHQSGTAAIKRLVIIKTLRATLAADQASLEQFLDEARVASMLNHPNIVAIHEVGEHQGMHFIAMEYIGGVDLAVLMREVLDRKQVMPWRVAAAIIKDAALGLDAAHLAVDEAGRRLAVVHRDVSPHNIMVRPDGVVKVVDFGVAKATNQQHETQANLIKGKVRYMAPEQIAGRPLDGRADQFGLGVVLWELCAARPLFDTDNPVEIYERTTQEKLPRLADVAPEVPPALSDVVARTLMPAREDRYPRCADLAQALRAVVETGGDDAAREVGAFVEALAGSIIAERVRDLTPRPVSLQGGAELACVACGHMQSAALNFCGACGAPVARRSPHGGASTSDLHPDLPPSAPTTASTQPLVAVPRLDAATPVLPPAAASASVAIDVSLSFMLSRALPQGSRELVMLAALVPGWQELLREVEREAMGAFAAGRLRGTLLRQLETLAAAHDGVFLSKVPERCVVAFGLDEARGDVAERALRFALDWRTALQDFARPPQHLLRLHAGVSRGLCDVIDVPGTAPAVMGAPVDDALALAEASRAAGGGVYVAEPLGSTLQARFRLIGPTEARRAWTIADEGTVAQRVPAALRANRRVLIIDDSAVFRRVEKEALRKVECTTLEASDGEQGVRLAIESVPDLILLDLQMPKMDGAEALAALRSHEATRRVPVLVVSTVSRTAERERLDALGVSGYVDKPVVPAQLIAAVRAVLGGAPATTT